MLAFLHFSSILKLTSFWFLKTKRQSCNNEVVEKLSHFFLSDFEKRSPDWTWNTSISSHASDKKYRLPSYFWWFLHVLQWCRNTFFTLQSLSFECTVEFVCPCNSAMWEALKNAWIHLIMPILHFSSFGD